MKTALIIIVSLALIALSAAGFVSYFDFSTEPQPVENTLYGKWKSEDKTYGDYEYFEFAPDSYTFENRSYPATYSQEGNLVTVSKRGESLVFKLVNEHTIERDVPRVRQIRYLRIE